MKKAIEVLLTSALLAAPLMTGCGGSSAAADAADETEAAAETTEAAAVESEAAASQSTEGIHFVDGYYATDANGNDFIIAFYENAPGDIAYVNDGTNEVCAAYTVENAKTDDGQDYILITVGQTQLGYIADGTDGGAYIVDTDGNIYGAQALTEDEADAIYQAINESANAQVATDAPAENKVTYVDGYVALDDDGSALMVAFFQSDAGDFAYVTDGQNEVLDTYTVSDAQTEDGLAYTLVTVGDINIGYATDDNGNLYMIDAAGNTYQAAALSQDEAVQLYDVITGNVAAE